MTTRYSRPFNAVLGLVILASPIYAQRPGQDALNRFIAAIPDSQVRRFWQDAARSSGLGSIVGQLVSNGRPVAARRLAQVSFPRQEFRPPRIAQSELADVRPYSSNPITEYRGRYVVTTVEPGHLTGRLDSITTPFELFYKLPENLPLAHVSPGTQLQLQLIDDSYGMSRHRKVFLTSESGTPLLLYYSDGSGTPYRVTLTDPPIQIAQQPSGRGGAFTVSISLAGQSTDGLRAGQRATMGSQGRRYEAVVLESAAGRTDPEAEGDRYHVTILIYALP